MIDCGRHRRAKKRSDELQITSSGWEDLDAGGDDGRAWAEPLRQSTRALANLREVDPLLAQLVDLHCFCGFSVGELAELRG